MMRRLGVQISPFSNRAVRPRVVVVEFTKLDFHLLLVQVHRQLGEKLGGGGGFNPNLIFL